MMTTRDALVRDEASGAWHGDGKTGARAGDGRFSEEPADDARTIPSAMLRGALHRCPACGDGGLYRAYLKIADRCPSCGEALFHQRADDAPPYVTIFVIGHLILASVVAVDIAYEWPLWLHGVVWLPLTVALCLAFLPTAKGALVGLQWALRMHGFGGGADGIDTHPDPATRSGGAEG